MLIVTMDSIPGKEIEALGLVKGSMIKSVNVGKDIAAGLKTFVGGEIKGYTKMMDDSRNIATERMTEQAEELGADAIVAVRYASASAMQGASEVMAYGTAVKFK